MKYLRIYNVSIHIIFFYQNRFINECVRKNFLSKDRRKDGAFLRGVEELTFLITTTLRLNFEVY